MIRISEIENEAAIDLLADIIEPAALIMADPQVQKMNSNGSPKVMMVTEILRNHKKEAIQIVSALHGAKPGEYRFNIISLIKDVLDILNDPDLQSVFTSQGQSTENVPSGSATESIEDENK